MQINVVITGTIALDTISTPLEKAKSTVGGSGYYASLAASLFCATGIVSAIGDDFPKKYLGKLQDRGIDISGVQKSGKTFCWEGIYEGDMSEAKTIETKLNCFSDFRPDLPAKYRPARYLFLGNLDPKVQLEVLRQMKNRPFVMLDTMNFWINTKKEQLLDIVSKCDLLFLNDKEAKLLLETENLIEAGKKALCLGPRYVVVKKGEHGALLFSGENHFACMAYPLEICVDPTGAGDSFAGAILGYLASVGKTDEVTLRKAMVYGACAASFCAEGMGIEKTDKISRKDVDERYKKFKKFSRF